MPKKIKKIVLRLPEGITDLKFRCDKNMFSWCGVFMDKPYGEMFEINGCYDVVLKYSKPVFKQC